MKNIKEFIKEIDKFKEFCVERAEHLAIIHGFGVSMTRDGLSYVKEIDEDSVLVEFSYNNYYGSSDYDHITLTIEQLEMDDDQWFKSLDRYREDFKLDQEKKKADKIQKEIREAELVKEWAEKQLNKLNENN